MTARIAGRLLTSPAAFLLAGVLEALRYLSALAAKRIRARLRPSTVPSHAR